MNVCIVAWRMNVLRLERCDDKRLHCGRELAYLRNSGLYQYVVQSSFAEIFVLFRRVGSVCVASWLYVPVCCLACQPFSLCVIWLVVCTDITITYSKVAHGMLLMARKKMPGEQ